MSSRLLLFFLPLTTSRLPTNSFSLFRSGSPGLSARLEPRLSHVPIYPKCITPRPAASTPLSDKCKCTGGNQKLPSRHLDLSGKPLTSSNNGEIRYNSPFVAGSMMRRRKLFDFPPRANPSTLGAHETPIASIG